MAANTKKTSASESEMPLGDVPVAVEPAVGNPTTEQIAELAYKFWEELGHPDGDAEANWLRAERQLRAIGPSS